MGKRAFPWALAVLAIAVGCGDPEETDAGSPEAGTPDSGPRDGGGMDSGAANDAGRVDAGAGGTDASSGDAALDAGGPGATLLRSPWSGYSTGSVHVPDGSTVVDHPLRPRFVWEPVAGAASYQLQVDDSCDAASFRSCPFDSPELVVETATTSHRVGASLPVATSAPVGRRYFWRVRACVGPSDCAEWSEVRYLDVGRQVDDFDGDGYADLVISCMLASNPETAEGNSYVYRGGPAGVALVPDLTLDNPAGDPSGWFGYSVAAVGDVNADGFADLVVGAARQDSPENDEGNAFVFLGGPSGLSASPTRSLDNPTDRANGDFGDSVAGVGDVDGDGYADVLIGAPGQRHAFLYRGGASGIGPTPDVTLTSTSLFFGGSVAGVGDLDGDGYPDIAVGGENVAFVYRGRAAGPTTTPDATVPAPGARFGAAVSGAGDVDADGFADLMVGAENMAFFFRGDRGFVSAPADLTLSNPVTIGGAGFGKSISSAGDMNGDGFGDVVVGAWFQDNPEIDEGSAYLYFGAATGLTATPDVAIDNPLDDDVSFFGSAVAGAGDLDGDGHTDVIIGAYDATAATTTSGRAFLFRGGPGVIDDVPDLTFDNPSSVDRRFGWAVH